MSSPRSLSVKRRRLNESTTRLNKPFVSPLRAPKTEQNGTPLENKDSSVAYLPSTAAHTIHAPPWARAKQSESISKVPKSIPSKSTPIRKQHPTTSSSKRKDAAEVEAERAITKLELQIHATKKDIDNLTQAAKLRSSTTDADLSALAEKWKHASQTAADELFGTVKERVNRMGGVAAWRESEKQKYDRSHGLGEFAEQVEEEEDADCEFDSQGEELPEEEVEWRKAQKRRVRREMMDAADVEDAVEDEDGGKAKLVWQEAAGDDDAFTMDMMLRSLNIELGLIGYDKHLQRWTT